MVLLKACFRSAGPSVKRNGTALHEVDMNASHNMYKNVYKAAILCVIVYYTSYIHLFSSEF